jgi:hypothetical protein
VALNRPPQIIVRRYNVYGMQTGTTGRVKSEYHNELFRHLFTYVLFYDVYISENVAVTISMISG